MNDKRGSTENTLLCQLASLQMPVIASSIFVVSRRNATLMSKRNAETIKCFYFRGKKWGLPDRLCGITVRRASKLTAAGRRRRRSFRRQPASVPGADLAPEDSERIIATGATTASGRAFQNKSHADRRSCRKIVKETTKTSGLVYKQPLLWRTNDLYK